LDRGDLLEIEQSGRGIAAMAGNDDAVIVDQNRNDKSECGDAVGNLTDLLARMGARVTTVRRELVDRSPADINHEFLNGRQGERVRADLRRYRPNLFGELRLGSYPRRSHRASAGAHCPLTGSLRSPASPRLPLRRASPAGLDGQRTLKHRSIRLRASVCVKGDKNAWSQIAQFEWTFDRQASKSDRRVKMC